MKTFLISSILALSVLLVTTLSYADDYTKPGFSLGVGGSMIFENFDTGISGLDFDESPGFNVKLGYRVNELFEAEIDYLFIDGFDGTVSGVQALELDGFALTGNGKLYLQTGKVQPYGLLGIGMADLEIRDTLGLGLSSSESDLVFRFGGGLDIYAVENVLFFAEVSYFLTHGDIEDTDFIPVTIGAKYKF